MGICICRVNRTMAIDTIPLLSGTIDVLITETVRSRKYGTGKKEERSRTIAEWDRSRNEGTQTGARRRKLIRNLTRWYLRKQGKVDAAVTQFMTVTGSSEWRRRSPGTHMGGERGSGKEKRRVPEDGRGKTATINSTITRKQKIAAALFSLLTI
ncbi:UNVERIFIED_CONTAM: hypothetical protein PYX00_003577 [Menopon gallinae]|uniref:Uncharacterized protein n=1 Tax=Menopon gallinae TaxID=328185 RepID=A0AAW2I0V2_9NEOP